MDNTVKKLEQKPKKIGLFDDKVRIIPFEQAHISVVYRWYHSGEYDMLFNNTEMMSLTEAAALVGNAFVVTDVTDINRVLGIFVIENVNQRNRNLLLHLGIEKEAQNAGIAKRSLVMMLNYIFNEMNMAKVKATISSDNETIKSVINSVGGYKEGTLKKEFYHNGKLNDVELYAMHKVDFRKRYN